MEGKLHGVASSSPPSAVPKLRVGGVPEHFNLPWHMGIERGIFRQHGVEVEWVEIKEGTGAMLTALKEDRVDIIVALTEGLVADIGKGSDVRLLASYVESPLTWAVSVGTKSPFHSIEDLRGQRFGVSRMGSGSAIMTYVLANNRGWSNEDFSLVVKGDFKNLRDSVNDGSTAAFLWETFTTKPYHLSGEVRRVGDVTTPWPCFMIASTKQKLTSLEPSIRGMLAGIRAACELFSNTERDKMPEEVAKRYGNTLEDAKSWYNGVRITASPAISQAALEKTIDTLKLTGVLPPDCKLQANDIIDDRYVELLADIKKMRLYSKPELVKWLHTSLRAKGLATGSISFKDLIPYDQHHYDGTKAVDAFAVEVKGAPTGVSVPLVINVGSGLGGPARYLAGEHGFDVLASELQEDLHATATELTSRCEESIGKRVTHIGGNFLHIARHLQEQRYDGVCSWLTVLHFDKAAREQLFAKSVRLLRPGGVFYAEDFVAEGELTAEERSALEREVFCKYLPTRPQYEEELKAAGFALVKSERMTEHWRAITRARADLWMKNREEWAKVHGSDVVSGLCAFYSLVAQLFEGGRLGGIRIVARR